MSSARAQTATKTATSGKHKENQLLALSRAARAIHRAASPEEVYRLVAEEMARLGYNASIFTLTEDGQHLQPTFLLIPKATLRAAEKLAGLSVKNYLYPLTENGFYARLLASTETVFLTEVPGEAPAPVVEALPEPLRPLAGKLAKIFDIRNTLHAPLFVGGAPFGVLSVTGTDLSEADIPAIATFADQVATALENLRLRAELRQWGAQLLQRVNEQTAALRQSEARFRALIDKSSDAIILLDAEEKIAFASPANPPILDYTPQEVAGQSITMFIHPEDRKNARELLKRLNESPGAYITTQIRLQRRDGTVRWVEAVVSNLLADPNVGRVIVNMRDITERKQAEAQIQLQSTALNAAANAILITDRDGTIQWINPAWTELTGYTPEEAVGNNPRLLKSGFHDQAFYKNLWDTILSGQVWRGELVNKRKDGSLYTEEETITPLVNADGKVTHFIGIKEDITERKRIEEKLAASEAELRALFASMTAVVLVIDRDGVYRKIAPTNPDLLFKPPDELLGKKLSDVFPAKQTEEFLKAIHEALQTGQTTHIEYDLPIEGRQVWFSTAITALDAENTVWVAHDITERKRSEITLQHQLKEITALHEVAMACSHAASEDDLIGLVTEVIHREFYPDHCGVLLLDAQGKTLLPHSSYRGIALQDSHPIPIHEGITGYVAVNGQPQRVADVHREPRYLEISPETRSELCVPLKSGEKILGVINAECQQENFFSEADERLLITIAGQLATAIERLRAEENERRQRAMAEALSATAAALNRSLDTKEILAQLLENIQTAIPSDAANMMTIEGDDLRFTHWRGYEALGQLEQIQRLRLKISEHPNFQTMIATRAPLLIEDTHASPLWKILPGTKWIRSFLATPILLDGQVIGFINLDHAQPNFFTPVQAKALQAFAEQASIALKNARLYAETRRRLAEMEAVNRVSTALRAGHTPEEMLPIMLDETLRLFHAEAGGVWLYDDAAGALKPVVARGWHSNLPHRQLKPGEGIIGHTFQSQEAYLTPDYHRDPHLFAANKANIPAGWGGICIPLRAAEEALGVFILSAPAPRQFSADDGRLLNTIAEIAGNAIRRAALHIQTEKQVERLSALRAIDLAISSILDLRVVLDILLGHVTTQLHVDAADILLHHPATQTLEPAAMRGFRSRKRAQLRLRLGESQAGKAALRRQVILIPDLSASEEAFDRPDLLRGENFAAYAAVPLVAKGQIKGVLEVFHREPIHPDAEWNAFLETLGRQVALAIDNAQLYNGLQRSNLELFLAYDATIEGWSKALDLRDRETEGHTQRVTELTLDLARALQIGEERIVHIRRGALLHDIGKMGVPDDILHKPSALTDEEWKVMRMHPVYAYEMLSPIAYLHPALDIPYSHHERWDGSGYPRGLKGEEIPLAARIFAVVDVYDALTSDRPYRKAWTQEQALAYLQEQSGVQFDPQVVKTFLESKIHSRAPKQPGGAA